MERRIRIAAILCASLTILSGCASYKFQRAQQAPYDKGYTASRDGYLIPEYTIGKENSLPGGVGLAKERFKRRRNTVEDYYKRMGYIENRFKMAFWDPCIFFLKTVGGIFRLPGVAISDYKYEHNPAYREKVIQREKEQDAKEAARIKELKSALNAYIQEDLESEEGL